MEKKESWKSPQALIIIAIILVIFVYIGFDVVETKPAIKSDIDSIRVQYTELTTYLGTKLPEIDSTLKLQAGQISSQSDDIKTLNEKLTEISEDDE